jgi:hypothetical protein
MESMVTEAEGRMATCDICAQEMTTAASCSRAELSVGGRRRPRIAFGDEKLWGARRKVRGERCNDCGVSGGGFHHPGCAREECMVCGGQLFACDCEKAEPRRAKPAAAPVARQRRR